MTLRLPRRRFWRATIYLVCLLLVLVAADLLWARARRKIRPGYQTTRIVEPRRDNGTVDYLTALEAHFCRGVTPDNNAFPVLLEALGPSALPKNQPPHGITDRLGMKPLPAGGDYFIDHEAFVKDHPEAADTSDGALDLTREQPWPPAASDATRQWIEANAKPLAKVAKATGRPRYFVPFNGGTPPDLLIGVQLPHLKPLRDAGSALVARALMRLEAGDTAGCREDLQTAHRLARLLGQGATLIERLVGISVEIAACRADRTAAASGKLSADDLRAMAAELAAMPELDAPLDAVDVSERYSILESMQLLARQDPVEAGKLFRVLVGEGVKGIPPVKLFPLLPIPYEQSMVEANRWYDGVLTALRQPTYPRREAAMNEWERQLEQLGPTDRVNLLSSTGLLRLFMPGLERVQHRWESTRAENRLSQVSLALAAFKAEHGTYPKTLPDLSPTFLEGVPLDNFIDRPLHYSADGGGYLLYSVGPNMADDGGAGTSPADDLAVSVK